MHRTMLVSKECLCCQDVAGVLALKYRTLVLPENETVYHQGDTVSDGYILCRGGVMIFRRIEAGNKRIVSLVRSGEFFGVEILCDKEVRLTSAKTLAPSQIHIIPSVAIHACLEDPEFCARVTRDTATGLCDLAREITISTYGNTDEKVASFICFFVKKYGVRQHDRSVRIPWFVTQDWLADALGMRRESAARAVHRLRQRGLISWEKRRLSVLNIEQLERCVDAF